VLAIPGLSGGPEILDHARRLDRGAEAAAALDNLAEVYGLLAAHGVAGRVTLDLGQVRGMDYYTGIAFEGFAAGMGFPVIGGGRYDNLIGQFGPALPAVGFALTIERALIALEREQPVSVSVAPDALVGACRHRGCLRWVSHMRTAGMRVEVDVLEREPAELIEYARQRGIGRVLVCEEGRLRALAGDNPLQGFAEDARVQSERQASPEDAE
jgi:ATP phosphoribosyltransferase regulatory subunit